MNTESKMMKKIKQSPYILRNLMIVSALLLLCLMGCSNKGAEEVGLSEDGGSSTPETDLITDTPEPDLNPTPSDADISENDTGDAVNLCVGLSDAFNQKIWDTSGWVHGVNDRMYFNNTNGAYDPMKVEEFWYRFDPEGFILEGYNWSGYEGEEIQPEGIWLNGWYDGVYVNAGYNLEYDFGPDGEIQGPHAVADAPYDFSAGFCAELAEEESARVEEMIFRSQAAWKFSYEIVHTDATTIRSIYFSQEDGTLLRYTTYKVKPDGSGQLILDVDYHTFEFNADPPEERFAEIWAQVPHGDDFVPVEEGAP